MQFHTKTVGWLDSTGSYHLNQILLQNRNGPCFIISFINTLILSLELKEDQDWHTVKSKNQRHKKQSIQSSVTAQNSLVTESDLRSLKELISSKNLVSLDSLLYEVSNLLLEVANEGEERIDLSDILNVLPLLSTGLNVNLKFDQPIVTDFEEETKAVTQLMDFFGLKMIHGFLMDDGKEKLGSEVAFDKAQEFMVKILDKYPELKEDDTNPEVVKYFTLKRFFEDNRTQLTKQGLKQLEGTSSVLRNNEFAIFFRNDHFNTIYKKENKLYTLVSDEGYKDESEVVWQMLGDVKGDEDDFLTGNFTKPEVQETKRTNEGAEGAPGAEGAEGAFSAGAFSAGAFSAGAVSAEDPFSVEDEILAKQLQQEEDAQISRTLQNEFDKEADDRGKKKKRKRKQKQDSRKQNSRKPDSKEQDPKDNPKDGCTIC
ncbi:hypothetical protein FOA43_002466 [Brettanomyces nanus]|uniref:MINDY deubiquitinase domain-containing protein n=1 Tax=Eeniella nana TaxID=13502 RepID=A0A875S2I0_EENNA|nr:uncharacterized protein FOA43_002466 [Brettanomyces nanus]QPG75123.1 hypothetical protein FOA43_002466 [Brettanomyces nanus]